MWVLVSVANPEQKYELLVDREYTVGRRDCDITIEGDQSISRRHATIKITHQDVNVPQPHKLPVFEVKDSSKLGSMVGQAQIKGSSHGASEGDVIKFGTMTSKFEVHYLPLVVTASCVVGAAKKKMKSLVAKLGGHMVSEWRKDCSFLLMSTLSITIKAVCALVSLKPIVTPQYLDDLIQAVEQGNPHPDPDAYTPALAESQLNPAEVSFKSRPARQKLFVGKMFIFLCPKQFKKLSLAVELAGGTPILMEEGTDDNEDDILVGPASVVMQSDARETQTLSQNAQEWIEYVQKALRKHKKRAIPDAEVGYAVLYCSTDVYCNPDSEAASQALHPVEGPSVSQALEVESFIEDSEQVPANDASFRDNNISRKLPKQEINSQPTSTKPTSKNPPAASTSARKETEKVFPDTSSTKTKAPVKVKAEPLTPNKPRQQSQINIDDEFDSVPTRSRRSSRKSPSPGPSVSKTKRKVSRSPSPVSKSGRTVKIESDEDDFDSVPTRTSRIRKVSQAPAVMEEDEVEPSARERRRTGEKAVKNLPPSPVAMDEFDFDSVPTRTSRSRKTSQVAAAIEEDVIEPPARERRRTGEKAVKNQLPSPVAIDEFDFDSVPTRTRRNRQPVQAVIEETEEVPSREPSPPKNSRLHQPSTSAKRNRSPSPHAEGIRQSKLAKMEQEDEFDAVPSRSRRNRKPSPGPSEVNIKKEPPSETKRRSRAGNSDPSTTADRSQPAVKLELGDTPATLKEEPVFQVPSSPSSPTSGVKASPTSPGGFISKATKQEALGGGDINGNSERDPSLPKNLVVTEVTSLMVRKPGQAAHKQGANEITSWNGKVVKNYKKFRKSTHTGADKLPRIIGGTDLQVHQSQNNKQLEDWFKEERQAETQNGEMDKIATQMFEWEPGKRRKR